jgi:formylglycine-generating enzyme required for sulfatase activity
MAQSIVVQSFQLDEFDLTANTAETTVFDQNGEKCALIKVETTQHGFTFDGGMLGVAKVDESHNGEIWVYVPDKLSHLTVSHPQLGILRNYDLGQSVRKGRTYIMKLTTGTVQTVVQQTVMSQYLVFQVTPKDAIVQVNNEAWPVTEGTARKFVPFGSYEYRVSSKLYHPEVGRIEVNNPNNKTAVTVNLKPAFGYISVPASAELSGATIYIDNEKVGQPPLTSGPLASGAHKVMAVKPLYQSKEQTVTVIDGQTVTFSSLMSADFSTVTFTVENNAEIWVNGEHKGNGTWTGALGSGDYLVETRLANHRSTSTTKRISSSDGTQTIALEAPTPIYGSINVSTTPDMSDVYIDNTLVGQTPLFMQQYLAGKHHVRISKINYADYQTDITVNEGHITEVGGSLSNVVNVTLTSNVNNAQLTIDGQDKGLLTSVKQLSCGSHQITLKANGYKDYAETIEVTPSQRTFNFSMVAKEVEKLTFKVGGVSFTMILVEGGTFSMGAMVERADGQYYKEYPVHQVTLSTYYIGETEVTQALWQAVMGENPSKRKGDNHPVDNVCWVDCQMFIHKLNTLTGKKFRLPTEAEWEYAARGGCKSQGYKYSGSNNLDEVAWCTDNTDYGHQEVKTLIPNELGLYDMSGNVAEFCQDRAGEYGSNPENNPTGAETGSDSRIMRGGYYYGSLICRVTARISTDQRFRSSMYGLRLAL